MLIAIFITFALLAIPCFIMAVKSDYNEEEWSNTGCLLIIVPAIICLIVAIILGIILSGSSIINDKIKLHEQENVIIQTEIAVIVNNYMQWEQETYEKFKNESPTILIELYPELKSNTLVTKQIDIFLENTTHIRNLKLQKLNYKPIRWWLYFGK